MILCSLSPGRAGRHDAGTNANNRFQVCGASERKTAAEAPRSGRGTSFIARATRSVQR